MDNAKLASRGYLEFTKHFQCKDAGDVQAVLSGQFFDEMGSCACECIENLKTWPEIRKLIEAIISGFDGRDFIEEKIFLSAKYLEDIYIAERWKEFPNDTFYSCIARAIGDGTDFLEYLYMHQLLVMPYDEFFKSFGCNSADDVREKLLNEYRRRTVWCAYKTIVDTERWSEIYDKAEVEEANNPEDIIDTLFGWLGDYLKEIDIVSIWAEDRDECFGDCLIFALGDGEDFLGYIQ